MSEGNGVLVVVAISPDMAAHLRQVVAPLPIESLALWPTGGLATPVAAVVVQTVDPVAAVVAVRRDTVAPLLLLSRGMDTATWGAALDSGADVCLDAGTASAVVARQLAALLRRAPATRPDTQLLSAGQLSIDIENRLVGCAGAELPLHRREFDLLCHMVRHRDTVLRRHDLLAAVWGSSFVGDSNTVDVHIAWLRQKLGANSGVRITTLRGLGYRFDILTPQPGSRCGADAATIRR